MPECKQCAQSFKISDADRAFYKKIDVPEPTLCPYCRMQRRFAIRNERNLYADTCDLCKKSIISTYSPDKSYTVYCQKCWWGDGWDASAYAMDFDFSKPFFPQFNELMKKVPRINMATVNTVNSDYCNYVADAKDSYLCFGSIKIENCLYGAPYESRDCVDTFLARECELCYECVDCEKLYGSAFSKDCSASTNIFFCYDCRGCTDCVGCTGLRNKSHYIFNQQYSPEEYKKKFEELNLGTFSGVQALKQKYQELVTAYPHRHAQTLNSEDVSGNYIVQSKNAHNCFDVKKCEDSRYCAQVIEAKDCYDTNYCEEMELSYDYIGYYRDTNVKFSSICGESSELEYCDFCSASNNLFGCIALRKKQYCILNKQYSKEEFLALRKKIIEHMKKTGEWGEFRPVQYSTYCFNESVAQDWCPLSRTEVLQRGWKWKEEEPPVSKGALKDLPDDIKEARDDIVGQLLVCAGCEKNYKIIVQELAFYRKMNLPLPRVCPNCRHKNRINSRTPRQVWQRACSQCNAALLSAYAPDRPEKILCETCYQAQVV